ncbi:IPIL1 protein, partial [Sapayoa aenigma]|nr:IPIL1 protein [Sapayoa aenigma]
VTALMDNVAFISRHILARTFYPLPQKAIGVGSAFEGWSPQQLDVLYQVLVPLTPPPGHTFQLEQDTVGQMPGRNFRIRVKQVCTCTGEQGEDMLCFLHHPEEELRANQQPSLLHTLCTGSYLDVHKTVRWFNHLLSEASVAFHGWHLLLLPSRRSCKMLLSDNENSFKVEVLFGVQEGDSEIYVTSQPTETPFTPRTVWPETYSVAELKFFGHIARSAPRNSCHLKCLQFLARALLGTRFSTYSVKTVMMHLLNTLPVSQWASRHFLDRLGDIIHFLNRSLLEKRLDHFVLGNQRFPQEIVMPMDIQTVEPPNLFHHLEQNPAAHTTAMKELCILQM